MGCGLVKLLLVGVWVCAALPFLQPGGGQSCPAVKVEAPLSLWSAWECCEEAGNVSIAPQGQSPLSHTMEGWAGPEKAEGWITAWSSAWSCPSHHPTGTAAAAADTQ